MTVKKVHIMLGMNKLSRADRVQIFSLLVEGMSLPAITGSAARASMRSNPCYMFIKLVKAQEKN